jgi:hypothetical protein
MQMQHDKMRMGMEKQEQMQIQMQHDKMRMGMRKQMQMQRDKMGMQKQIEIKYDEMRMQDRKQMKIGDTCTTYDGLPKIIGPYFHDRDGKFCYYDHNANDILIFSNANLFGFGFLACLPKMSGNTFWTLAEGMNKAFEFDGAEGGLAGIYSFGQGPDEARTVKTTNSPPHSIKFILENGYGERVNGTRQYYIKEGSGWPTTYEDEENEKAEDKFESQESTSLSLAGWIGICLWVIAVVMLVIGIGMLLRAKCKSTHRKVRMKDNEMQINKP